MIEVLLSCIILVDAKLIEISEYEDQLNQLFLDNSNDKLLLKLQWCFSDINQMIKLIDDYLLNNEINYDVFGRNLVKKLNEIYINGNVDIKDFNSKVLRIWGNIPNDIQLKEPFWMMSYASEPLSWGDVEQTHKIYKKMFNFYNEKTNGKI